MKVLITGANGRIGQQLAASLAPKHDLVLLSHGLPAAAGEAKTYSIDLSDPAGLEHIIADERPDVIIHLAAMVGPACDKNPELARKINVDATVELAKVASRCDVKKLIFASTAAVYHQTVLVPTDEDSNVDPQSVYGKTKLAAERSLAKALKGSDTKLSILRIFNVYGTGFDSSLVFKLAHSSPDCPVTLHGLKNYYRDYVHITDIVKAFGALVENGPENPAVLNIGSGRVLSNGELIEELQNKGFSPHYKVVDNDFNVSWANIDRAKASIGFNPNTSLAID